MINYYQTAEAEYIAYFYLIERLQHKRSFCEAKIWV